MTTAQAIFYLIGVVLLAAAGFGAPNRPALALLGASSLALGFTLPVIVAGL